MIAQLFASATFKLTVWYLAILMILSVGFSVLIYQLSSQEINREFPEDRSSSNRFIPLELQIIRKIREHQAEESNARLRGSLLLLNLATLGMGGYASYLLARRTLRPIRDAMAAQARFTSDASHELRTPLTNIRTELEVALNHRQMKPADMREQLRSSLEDVVDLQRLTDRLLQLAQGHELAMERVALDDIATTAVNRYITQAQDKNISIDNAIGRESVYGNSDALGDCLGIIIDNAIKYSPDGSTIKLTSRTSGKDVEVVIEDHGQGIPTHELDKVFERFYRSDTARTKSSGSGFGLGLSIAKRLIELHKGTIQATSQVGKGTIMTLRLPRYDSAGKTT